MKMLHKGENPMGRAQSHSLTTERAPPSLADLKRRHESASAPYVQARQDVGLEDDGDASFVRGRRKGPNAVVRVAPERDELVRCWYDGCIEGGRLAVFELVQRACPQTVLVEPRIRDLLDLEPAALHVGGDTHVQDVDKVRDVPARRVRKRERLVDVPVDRIALAARRGADHLLRGRCRVDGVGRAKFDFQTGAYVDATAGAMAKYGGKGCRYDQDVEALARAAGLRVARSERFGGGFFGSFELAPAPS